MVKPYVLVMAGSACFGELFLRVSPSGYNLSGD